jgi:hypothetical protein
MTEIWKDIPNYEGFYQVSNFGNIKSFHLKSRNEEKILKTTKNAVGYLNCNLCKNGNRKLYQVHQLVAMAFLNHTPNGITLVVNHINFNRLDNRVENLEIVTHRENTNKRHLSSSSQYTGVVWYKRDKKWKAQIRIKKKLHHLGYFDCELKASEAYQNALKQLTL